MFFATIWLGLWLLLKLNSSHSFTMVKVKICNICWRYLNFYYTGFFIGQLLKFCLNHWIWLVARTMQSKITKFFKHLLRNQEGDEADTFHKCKWQYPLHKLFVPIAKERWLLTELAVFTDIQSEKEKNLFLLCYCIIFLWSFAKCSWSSSLLTMQILSKCLFLIGCHGIREAHYQLS